MRSVWKTTANLRAKCCTASLNSSRAAASRSRYLSSLGKDESFATDYGFVSGGFVGSVGKTPLMRVNWASKVAGSDIFAKAEFMNPGGSVKDRAALGLVRWAEQKGNLKPGGTIVEGTAGNTGIGLAHICRARGYKCVIYMPNTQSQAKIDLLRALGADVRPVPAVPFDNPENYNHQAKRYAESLDNAVWVNQFDNAAGNRAIHIETTGPEIWNQCKALEKQDGVPLSGFTCSTGTGGTFAGITRYLKDASGGSVKCYLADPPGSVLYKYFSEGKIERTGDGSITEGIGQGRITDNVKPDVDLVDGAYNIPDQESINAVYSMLHEDGLFVGASSGLNVSAAIRLAKDLGPGSRVVTILCDTAQKYQARLFSKSWLIEKNLYDGIPEHLKYLVSAE